MDAQQVWWRPEGRSPFALDPTKPAAPQILSALWQFGIIFGGPLLGLFAINHYPFLIENRTLYIGGLISIAFLVFRELCDSTLERLSPWHAGNGQIAISPRPWSLHDRADSRGCGDCKRL
jgi:hypothetical protein